LYYSTANIRLVGPILCSKLGYFEMLKTLLIDPINTRGTIPYTRLMYGITVSYNILDITQSVLDVFLFCVYIYFLSLFVKRSEVLVPLTEVKYSYLVLYPVL
jgi:hypothetical protein